MPQTGYSIRQANPGDRAGVTELLRASYPTLMGPAYDAAKLRPALTLMTRANPKLLSSGTFYVAEAADGSIVGCGGWSRERPGGGVEAEAVGHIRHFGTHPEWTRRGIGQAIFRRCEAAARDAGIRELECYASLNAERFYAALGFERVKSIDVELSPDVSLTGCLMRYRI